MVVQLDNYLNPRHKEFFQATDEEIIFYGGSDAGKSYSAADKIIVRILTDRRKLKVLVVRKSMPSLKRSCLDILLKRLDEFHIPYDYNRVDTIISFPDFHDSKIIFISINNFSEIEKAKSITDVDIIWIEEANEILEAAYDECRRRLRGGKGLYEQLIMTFNPIGTTNWIYKRHFELPSTARKIRVNIDSNPWATEQRIQRLKVMKGINEQMWRVYYLGEWGVLEGAIYTNWEVVDEIPKGVLIHEVINGLDFGYNHPAAVVKVHIADSGAVYLEEKIYQSGLITPALGAKMRGCGIGKQIVYADTEDPGRIEELCNAGFVVLPAEKDVEDGINFIKGLPKVYVLSSSVNLIKEQQSYCWMRDKNGQLIDGKPVKFRDDLMDAVRYALFSHRHNLRSVARPKRKDPDVTQMVKHLRPVKGVTIHRNTSAMSL